MGQKTKPAPLQQVAGFPLLWKQIFTRELEDLANLMPSASPTSLERWANSKLLAAPLQSNCGPSASHRQYLVMGHPHAIGSAGLECFWAIRRPSAARILRGAWPIRCHRHHLPLWRDGPTQCHWQCGAAQTRQPRAVQSPVTKGPQYMIDES
jgi:hypothetical protein